MVLFQKKFKAILLYSNMLLILFPFILSTDCSTPAECYIKAVETLKQDREEMRRQLDSYQMMYEDAKKENKILKDSLNQLENTLNSKISEYSQNFNSQLIGMKSYLQRPYTAMDSIIYQSGSLTINLSTLPLNGLIPLEANKILIYIAYSSGTGWEQHGDIHLFTKVSGIMHKRSLRFDGYQQNAYNSNSAIFEMEVDGIDMNLYYKSDVNYDGAHFYIMIKILGYK